jgi:hypothetical protein
LKALEVGRTSCTSFWANQLRVLMQEIRLAAALTAMARAQVWTLRERLLKLGVRVAATCSLWTGRYGESWAGGTRSRRVLSGKT